LRINTKWENIAISYINVRKNIFQGKCKRTIISDVANIAFCAAIFAALNDLFCDPYFKLYWHSHLILEVNSALPNINHSCIYNVWFSPHCFVVFSSRTSTDFIKIMIFLSNCAE